MDAGPLPPGWVQRVSKSNPGKPYYFSEATGESVWDRPMEPSLRPAPGGPSQVQASHILRKWSGSRRPSSWRVPTVTCSKGEATKEIADMRAAIVAGTATFEQLAATSDCSSARNGGDLGMFARGAMQKPFEDAAFALAVGQMSGIVETESGIHIILRTR